jgi:putative cell wall-binding protein
VESGDDLTVEQYPAAIPGVISVAASDKNSAIYPWSYRGSSWVDVSAPGCIFDDEEICGTSFAAPAVAGVLAMGSAVAPCISGDVLEDALFATAETFVDYPVAYGRVDGEAFLDGVMSTEPAIRLSGLDRISTAISIARRAFAPGSAPAVVLARSDSYADALAAAPLAAKVGGPVLLTPKGFLAASVASEISELGASDVWLAGGEAALSQGVVDDLTEMGFSQWQIHRRSGANRYETAAEIGMEVGGDTVFIVSGGSFPDGVAASNIAAHTQSPILLVGRDFVPTATLDALDALDPTSVYVVGGTSVISDAVKQQLETATSLTIERKGGATRYATSEALAEMAVTAGLDATQVWVATGANFPDALATGPAAAEAGGVLLLADSSAAMARSWIAAKGSTTVDVAGGPLNVSDGTMCTMAGLLSP